MSHVPDVTLIQLPSQLQGERLLLRAARAGDGLAYRAAVVESLPQLKPWMHWAQTAPTPEQSEGVVRRMAGQFVLRQDLSYVMFEPDGGTLVGAAGLHRMDWALRRFEIGYWLRRSAWGQGFACEAVNLLSAMAFAQLRARRLEIRVDARNLPSRAVAERCGFELEGVLRAAKLDVAGLPCDECVYARISSGAN